MDGSLEVFGLGDADERVYRFVVARPTAAVSTVVGALDLDAAEARGALRRLHDLGLVNRGASADDYFAVDPRNALRAVVEQHERDVAGVREALPELGRMFDDGRRPPESGDTTRIITGPQEIGDWYHRLKFGVTTEFAAFDTPPYVLSSSRSLELSVLDRGVRVRAVYSAASFEATSRWADVVDLSARGEQARVTRVLPIKLAIADRRAALLSLASTADGTPRALATEASQLVDALQQLFELHWTSAVPVAGGVGLDDTLERSDGLDLPAGGAVAATVRTGVRPARGDERTLLTMFAAGLKDETIAKQLGISSRTLRRRVQELWSELGVDNRFAAGVEAARRGWL